MDRVLFISHKKAQCGVYEFGKKITDVLALSKKYEFVRVECSSMSELQNAIAKNNPVAIIYNYYPSVLPWIATKISKAFYKSNITSVKIPQIGIIHEITQNVADSATSYRKKFLFGRGSRLINTLFDFYIAPDPTLLLLNPLVYKTGRLVLRHRNVFQAPSTPTIGSFGFATPGKGFEEIVQLVQSEFDEAVIRFNIPAADFGGDKSGAVARATAQKCESLLVKPGIKLNITHDFLTDDELLDFLAQNTANVFLYNHSGGRGLSSAIDLAMAAQRPIAISDNAMFRHVLDVSPSICIAKNDLMAIIQNGFAPLREHFDEWSAENLLWDYERIVDSVLVKRQNPPVTKKNFIRKLYSTWRRLISKPDRTFSWLRSSDGTIDDDMSVIDLMPCRPIEIPNGVSLNRVLDNDARKLYESAINKIAELVPKMVAKKISEANVQQAFVFDTVCRYLRQYQNPKILCVGSYEDTASMGLIKMGIKIEEIDPMINYSLEEYFTKPSTARNSYDIIFSTSVIEHDPDDESFVKCVANLLALGGVFVMTCDYKDGWKIGDSKPEVDARLYTKNDLLHRLLPLMVGCDLVDEPQWECLNPDFIYLGKYRYTFATFVVKKIFV